MTTRTGIMDLTGSGKDLAEMYETRVSGPTGTTHYLSQTYNKDLGSIFYLNANLGGLGMTGTNGANCGYKLLNGTDLGSMFCAKGTVSYTEYVLNGNFSSPTVATNSFTANPTITNWTKTGGGSIYACNGTGTFACTTLPSTQYIALQANSITTLNLTQTLTIPVGSYSLSFYSWPRSSGGYTNSCSLSVYIGTTNLTPTPIVYTANSDASLRTIQFTITSSYDLKFLVTNTVSNDSTICLAKISVVKVV